MRIATGLLLALSAPALAQSPGDFTQLGEVLAANPARPWMANGVGAPTVIWDTVHNRYVMFFEALTSTTHADCPVGIWAIGAAVSTDGVNWTVRPTPILEPTPGDGSQFSCVAAHPTAVFNPAGNGGNGSVYVHFKGEQDSAACSGGGVPPTWGCEQYTGVSRLRVDFRASGSVQRVAILNQPSIPISSNMGSPSMVRVGGTWQMALGQYPDIYMASGPGLNSLSIAATPALAVTDYAPGISWVEDEFYSPSMICEDASAPTPYKMYVGGRDYGASFATFDEAGWSSALSLDATNWMLNTTPMFNWTNDNEFRHIEGLRVGTSEYVIWYTDRSSGTNAIHFATTDLAFVPSQTYSKICP